VKLTGLRESLEIRWSVTKRSLEHNIKASSLPLLVRAILLKRPQPSFHNLACFRTQSRRYTCFLCCPLPRFCDSRATEEAVTQHLDFYILKKITWTCPFFLKKKNEKVHRWVPENNKESQRLLVAASQI
jgi:hypothetical protein